MTLRQSRFGPIEVAHSDGVLVPRQWTIEQSRWAVALLRDLPEGPVLELCAGAGQIGLVVAVETGRALVQVDGNPRACTNARSNAMHSGVTSDVRCGDLRSALAADERFPLVLADPPYVPSDEVEELPEDPKDAIDGGVDGLDVARTCIGVAAAHLLDGGLVLVQLRSLEQADLVGPSVAELGLESVEVRAVAGAGALVLLGQVSTRRDDLRADLRSAPQVGRSWSAQSTGAVRAARWRGVRADEVLRMPSRTKL